MGMMPLQYRINKAAQLSSFMLVWFGGIVIILVSYCDIFLNDTNG